MATAGRLSNRFAYYKDIRMLAAATPMIEFGHLSHVGLRRKHNEDTYFGSAELGLWLVADGMGGHEYGEIASAVARETVVREVRAGSPLIEAIRKADAEIIEISQMRQRSLPMGTTIASACIRNDDFEVAWVGDSRAYLWRDGRLQQLSQDHSIVQDLIEKGAISTEQARRHPHRNIITQALGITEPDQLNIETVAGHLAPGDQLLLCSDGLTEELDDSVLTQVLSRKELSAQECVDQLVLAALERGGTDNITAIVIRRH